MIQGNCNIDEIQTNLSCGINMVSAIHTAMDEGSAEPSCFVDALFGAVRSLSAANEDLSDYIAELRNKGKVTSHAQ